MITRSRKSFGNNAGAEAAAYRAHPARALLARLDRAGT